MRRMTTVFSVIALAVLGSAGFIVLSHADPQAKAATSIDFFAADMRNSSPEPEGSDCGIGIFDGPFPGFPKQVIVEDAAGTIVAKQSLTRDAKVRPVPDGSLHCVAEFSIEFPDTDFVTIFVDNDRVTTLAKDDVPFAAGEKLKLWIQE